MRKPPTDVGETDVTAFIARRIEENLNLEYKDIRLYENVDELSKKVSGFANSSGGLLLLGISEEEPAGSGRTARIFPRAITWGNASLSKETLEDRLNARVRPRIDGLKIVPVRKESPEVIFLLDVPQSENPPHMAFDNRYYKRPNFETVPMEHYEVSDLFGRRRHPRLVLLLELPEINRVRSANSSAEIVTLKIRIYLSNVGKAAAKHTFANIQFDNLQIEQVVRGNFTRIDHLRGGAHTVQFSHDIGVLHVAPYRIEVGEIQLRVVDTTIPIGVSWSIVAEDMGQEGFRVSVSPEELEGMRARLQSRQSVILEPPPTLQ